MLYFSIEFVSLHATYRGSASSYHSVILGIVSNSTKIEKWCGSQNLNLTVARIHGEPPLLQLTCSELWVGRSRVRNHVLWQMWGGGVVKGSWQRMHSLLQQEVVISVSCSCTLCLTVERTKCAFHWHIHRKSNRTSVTNRWCNFFKVIPLTRNQLSITLKLTKTLHERLKYNLKIFNY